MTSNETDSVDRESSRTVSRRKHGVVTTASHSVRTPNDVWKRASERAARDGTKLNRVMIELLDGYAEGIYQLPVETTTVTKVYPRQPDGKAGR